MNNYSHTSFSLATYIIACARTRAYTLLCGVVEIFLSNHRIVWLKFYLQLQLDFENSFNVESQ